MVIETLENRLAMAVVVSTDFTASGKLDYFATDLRVNFSVPVLNAEVLSNYEFRRAGPDALLIDSDPVVNPMLATVQGNSVVLQFPGLQEDVYRLVIKDNITDLSGNRLDGDQNGTPGGDWRQDFVVNMHDNNLEPISVAQVFSPYGSSAIGWGERTVSADGRYIVFMSSDSNLAPGDVNGLQDVFWKDMVTGEIKIASSSASGVLSNNSIANPSISGDGRYVVFKSWADNLIDGTTSPRYQVYVKDMITGTLRFATSDINGNPVPQGGEYPMISFDGRYVSFSSYDSTLVPNDTNGRSDVFLKDMQTGAVTLLSVDGAGVHGDQNSTYPYMSNNGQFVVFMSEATNFSPDDTNNMQDAYLKNVNTGELTLISVSTAGDISNNFTMAASVTDDGDQVVFSSMGSNLDDLVEDSNFGMDVFIRNVGAGTTTLESRAMSVVARAGNWGSQYGSLDSTGRYLLFSSMSTDLVLNDDNFPTLDIFVKDLQTGTVTLLTADPAGNSTTPVTYQLYAPVPSWSQNGTYAVFHYYSNMISPHVAGGIIYRKNVQSGAIDVVNTRHSLLPSITANGESSRPSISETGRFVAFESEGNNLAVDGNTHVDVFVRDRMLGITINVATASDGTPANDSASDPSISGDGRFVAFASRASNLVPDDTNDIPDVFVKDLQTGAITRASTQANGDESFGFALSPAISKLGSHVAFLSNADDLVPNDTNGIEDIFVKDLTTGSVTRVNVSNSGQQANGYSSNLSISETGQFVVFQSSADNLVPGDNNASLDVFIKDLGTGNIQLVSTGATGIGNGGSFEASIAPNGRWVVFSSDATNLIPNDNNGTRDIFWKDMQTGEIKLVSSNANGDQADSWSEYGSVSLNGSFVSFMSTASNLLDTPVPSRDKVFVKNMVDGSVTLQSPLPESIFAFINSTKISGDGTTVAFTSNSDRMIGGDFNGAWDIFVSKTASPSNMHLADTNDSTYTVDSKFLGSGSLVHGPANAFDGYNRMFLESAEYFSTLGGFTTDAGQTAQLPEYNAGQYRVYRKVYVPDSGPYSFVRTVDTFTNSSFTSSTTATINYFGNLGSNAQTTVFATSDGDLTIEAEDTWFATDDASANAGSAAVVHLLHGPNGISPTVSVVEDNIHWAYTLTLAAAETARIASFAIVAQRRADAITAVNALFSGSGFNASAIANLTSEEVDTLANFQFQQFGMSMTVDVPTFREDAGNSVATVTLTRSGDLSSALTVQLANSDTSEISWPASASFPANVATIFVPINAVDDSILDGSQTVSLGVSAVGYPSRQIDLTVLDAESLLVSANLASVRENAGAQAATITIGRLNTDISQPITVLLSSNDTTEATVPASVTIPANASSTTVFLDAIDDALLDGAQVVVITAQRAGYDVANHSMFVLDYEKLNLSFSPATILENAGTNASTLTVTRPNTDRSQAITVALNNPGPGVISLPANVVIPANAASATVNVDAIDDNVVEGLIGVVVSGSSAGYEPGTAQIDVIDIEPLSLSLDRTSFRENATGNAALLTITRPASNRFSDLVVNLSSSDTSEVTLPATVTIPNGATFVNVALTAVDDSLLDGSQSVTIRVTAQNYEPTTTTVTVLDAESLVTSFDKPSVAENSGSNAAILTVSRSNTDTAQPLVVQLTNNDTSEISVPPTVTIPANASSVQVPVAAVDDLLLDGTQTVQISATATGYDGANATIQVSDVETLTVTTTLASFREDAGASVATLTVTRSNTNVTSSLVVSIANPDPSEISMPTSVTIPAGQASANFPVNAVDDAILDGTQQVLVIASASGYTGVGTTLSILDAEGLLLNLNRPSIAENAGNNAATLTIRRSNTNITQPLVVNIGSTDTTEASLAATVTIPANQSEVQVPVNAIDDALLDGVQIVGLSANANGYDVGNTNLQVTDVESLSISSLVTSVRENAGAQGLRVTISRSNTDVQSPLTVNLASSLPQEIASPGTVTIPADSTSVDVLLDVLDDTEFDGTKTVTLSVSHPNYLSGNLPIDVLDVEQVTITSSLSSVAEDAGASAIFLTIRRENSDIGSDVTLDLASSNIAELAVPQSVTIPAGEAEVMVPVDIIDDTLLDGNKIVTITVSGGAYETNSLQVTVEDIEKISLTLSASQILENAGANAATLTVRRLNTDIAKALVVPLQVNLPGNIVMPAQVTIPANQTQRVINLGAIDDDLLDGPQQLVIAANASGYQPANVQLVVDDFETILLSSNVNQMSENGGTISLTVTRGNTDWDLPVLVGLSSNDVTEATVPESITIPAGSGSAVATIRAVDDSLLDGTRPVQITAIALGYVMAQTNIQVADAESLLVSIDKPTIHENAGTQAARITVTRSNSDITQSLVVSLQSSDTSEVTVAGSLTIPAGQASASTFLNAIDDLLLDGTQTVALTASATGYQSGSASIDTNDVESLTVQLSAPSAPENAGSGIVTATIRRSNSDTSQPLNVSLDISDSTELQGPTTVVIPANQSSISVPLNVMDDSLLDGTQTVSLSASALGYSQGSSQMSITDVELLTISSSLGQISEDAGTSAATITVSRSNTDANVDLTVQLVSSDRSEATLPASIVIPSGQTSISFPLSAVDDSLLDGPQSVELRASAVGYFSGSGSIQVLDAEQITLSLSKNVVSETAGSNAAMLTVRRSNSDRSIAQTIQLNINDASEISLPTSVEIPANAAFVQVPIEVRDDDLLDGTQVVTIVASAVGYGDGNASLSITDVERLTLTLNKGIVREDDGPNAAELTIHRSNTDNALALQVNLASSLTGEIALPTSIQIPANAASITIPIAAVEDSLLDGLKNGSLVASAVGYADGTVAIKVEDAESLQLQLNQAGISENGGTLTGTLRRSNTDTGSALNVVVSSNATSRLSFPATIIIPAGEQSTTFTIVANDDNLLQGDITVNLQATKSGYAGATASFQLRDAETLDTRFTVNQIAEKLGTTQLIVSRSDTDSPEALSVQLTVDRNDLVQVPASVTIPARQSSISINLVAIDDFLFDGDATLKITASAAGFQSTESSLLIIDEETKKPGTNPRNPLDVNDDTIISPLDSLLVLNRLNLGGVIPLTELGRFYDTSSDLIVSPLDALRVINHLNIFGAGEGELLQPEQVLMDTPQPHTIEPQHAMWCDLDWLDESKSRRRRGVST